ncbi:hypothetical protein TNCV_2017141 [Trichonephila clavipes]|nr:hypothetical protein TNCV_2017141 [Trichonephila clavipes]
MGQLLHSDDDAQAAVLNWFPDQPTSFFADGVRRRLIAWEGYELRPRRTMSVDQGTNSELQPVHHHRSEVVDPLCCLRHLYD